MGIDGTTLVLFIYFLFSFFFVCFLLTILCFSMPRVIYYSLFEHSLVMILVCFSKKASSVIIRHPVLRTLKETLCAFSQGEHQSLCYLTELFSDLRMKANYCFEKLVFLRKQYSSVCCFRKFQYCYES